MPPLFQSSINPVPIEHLELKRKSVRGGAITIVAQAVSFVIQVGSTITLARLLSPDAYGTIAMVMAFTGFAAIFRDLGLSSAAIQKEELTHLQHSNLFWLNLAVGCLITLFVAACAPLVAWFYSKPELTNITLVLSLTFAISSFSAQHSALLVRNMQFARSSFASIAGAITSLAVAVTLALKDYSYWALVWGSVAGATITSVALFSLAPFRPAFPSRGSGVKEMVGFGANITAFNFLNYFQRNLDNILIGKFWGSESLGLYSKAYSLLMLPINNILGPIRSVAFPALSRLQSQPEIYANFYLKTTSLIALLSMPLCAFLYVASNPIIHLALGSQWLGTVPIFSFLALASFIQPVSGFAGTLLLSLGQGKRYLACGAFNVVVICICFIIGIKWGAVGVAAAYAVGNYVVLYPWLRWAFQNSPITFGLFARACAIPVAASLFGATSCLAIIHLLPELPPYTELFILLPAFIAFGSLPVLLTTTGRTLLRQMLETLQHLRGKSYQSP